MKRSISLLSALAFVLMFSGSAFGQAATTNVDVTADVVGSLSASTDAAMAYGKISDEFSGNQPDIEPESSAGGGTFDNTGSSAQQGEVSITGSASQGIIIYFNNPGTLESSNSPGTPIGFTGDYLGNNSSDGSGTDESLDPTTNNSTSLDSNGDYSVYLGGTLDMNGNSSLNADSDYQGTITVNVDFQ